MSVLWIGEQRFAAGLLWQRGEVSGRAARQAARESSWTIDVSGQTGFVDDAESPGGTKPLAGVLMALLRGEETWIAFVEEDGEVRRRYPIGYPFPYLPTGHRHPAFQITDAFLAHPRSLAFMGEAYADKRFVFHPEGRFSVVDEAGNLVEGPHFDGVWRWTKGHLEMTVRDDRSYSINWRELAVDVDPPKMWSRFSRDVGGW